MGSRKSSMCSIGGHHFWNLMLVPVKSRASTRFQSKWLSFYSKWLKLSLKMIWSSHFLSHFWVTFWVTFRATFKPLFDCFLESLFESCFTQILSHFLSHLFGSLFESRDSKNDKLDFWNGELPIASISSSTSMSQQQQPLSPSRLNNIEDFLCQVEIIIFSLYHMIIRSTTNMNRDNNFSKFSSIKVYLLV